MRVKQRRIWPRPLAMWWNLKIVSLEPQPNKNTKNEANKQKPNSITSAKTAADCDKMMKLTTSSHHIAKPPVVPSLLSIWLFYAFKSHSKLCSKTIIYSIPAKFLYSPIKNCYSNTRVLMNDY